MPDGLVISWTLAARAGGVDEGDGHEGSKQDSGEADGEAAAHQLLPSSSGSR